MTGNFEQGWPAYESRFKAMGIPERGFSEPHWAGEDLCGRRILVHAEQGLGDAIQFVRYVPMLRERGASVILEAPRGLTPLFAGIADAVVEAGAPLPDFDCHAPLLSLPRGFGTRLSDIPAAVPYLRVPEDRVRKWRERLGPARRRRVGLVWAGSATHPINSERSIAARLFRPLARIPDIELFSLQKGPEAGQIAELAGCGVIPLEDFANDILDTAAILTELDLLVTVDTMVAHLAGALGRPVWTLLATRSDWRWMLDRPDTPWYPTMRLFRQSRRGDWTGPIDSLVEALS
jgi:hypothetical protein